MKTKRMRNSVPAGRLWRNVALATFFTISAGVSVEHDDRIGSASIELSSALAADPCAIGQVADRARAEYGDDLLRNVVDGKKHGPDSVGLSAKELRQSPGVASVSRPLPDTPKTMMRGTEGNAGLVPKEVADRLKGKEYSNFDEFRSDFWKATSETRYAGEFSDVNQALMAKGNAPFVLESQSYGGHKVYELHHITPIGQGGSVYDMSNIMITTPRFHLDVLKRNYHYGS